jgi:hypothetical protein
MGIIGDTIIWSIKVAFRTCVGIIGVVVVTGAGILVYMIGESIVKAIA